MKKISGIPNWKIVLIVSFLNFLNSATIFAQIINRDSLANNPKLFLEGAIKLLEWEEPSDPLQLVGPIYFVGTKGLSSFLIKTNEGLIIINTAMPASGELIKENIQKLGFNPKDVKYILTGHAHIDHCGGHSYIKKDSGAKVAVMAEDVALLESGGKTDFHYGRLRYFLFEPVKVDIVLRNGDVIKLGDITLTAYHTPGHTKGATTWETNIVVDGKNYSVVFPDGTTINPGYRIVKNPSYPGIENDYRTTLHKLEMIKPDIWFSLHTEFFNYETKKQRALTEGINAWIDPEGYRQRIAGEREKFENQINIELGVSPIRK